MRFNFTPAAERALLAAAGWTSCNDSDELDVPEVLLGLLAEPECRAALLLARYGIDAEAVRRRFASLTPAARTDAGSGESLFRQLAGLLADGRKPARSNILGPCRWPPNICCWASSPATTRSRPGSTSAACDAESLEAEVHRLSGHQPGPLPFDSRPGMPNRSLPPLPLGEGRGEGDELGPTLTRSKGRGTRKPASDILPQRPTRRLARDRCGRQSRRRSFARDRGLSAIRARRPASDEPLQTGSPRPDRRSRNLSLRPSAMPRAKLKPTWGQASRWPPSKLATGTLAVLHANFNRLEQSLRSLEEFSKILSPDTAAIVEQLRYRVYTLQRAVDITARAWIACARARLYVLVDGGSSIEEFRALIEQLISSGVAVDPVARQAAGRSRVAHPGPVACANSRGQPDPVDPERSARLGRIGPRRRRSPRPGRHGGQRCPPNPRSRPA